MVWPDLVTLTGTHVVLEPLNQSHADDLARAASGLQGLWYTTIPTPDGVPTEIERRMALDTMLPFAILNTDGHAGRDFFSEEHAGIQGIED